MLQNTKRQVELFEMPCFTTFITALCVIFLINFTAMLHETIFLAICNATMTNKKPFKLQRACYTQATCLATLRKVEGRSTFLATRNATIAVAKWGVTREFFLATCNATFVALQVAGKIASCNMAFNDKCVQDHKYIAVIRATIFHVIWSLARDF